MPASTLEPTLELYLSEPLNAFVVEHAESKGFATPAAFVEDLLKAAWQEEMRERDIDTKIMEAVHSTRPKHRVTAEFWEELRGDLQVKPKAS